MEPLEVVLGPGLPGCEGFEVGRGRLDQPCRTLLLL